jgi:putative transposase
MKDHQKIHHTKWDYKYKIVFVPKGRKKKIFGVQRKDLGDLFHELATQKELRIE